jgi:hypothetical protein
LAQHVLHRLPEAQVDPQRKRSHELGQPERGSLRNACLSQLTDKSRTWPQNWLRWSRLDPRRAAEPPLETGYGAGTQSGVPSSGRAVTVRFERS